MVKANFASPDDGYMEAQEAYDALYYEDSDTDDPPDHIGESNDASEDQQDFHEPLRVRPSPSFIPTQVCQNRGDCPNWGDLRNQVPPLLWVILVLIIVWSVLLGTAKKSELIGR